MPLTVQAFNRPKWMPLPFEGCTGVESIGLARLENQSIAMLRFQPQATIHEHAADIVIDVFCLEGEGMTSVSGESTPIHAGQWVRWPAGQPHRLWTENSRMVTLMIEHKNSPSEG